MEIQLRTKPVRMNKISAGLKVTFWEAAQASREERGIGVVVWVDGVRPWDAAQEA
jgi:hypothetical protein